MRKRDLFNLMEGSYNLTDSINNYKYTMKVSIDSENMKSYRIIEKGGSVFNSIYLYDKFVDEYGEVYSDKKLHIYKTIASIVSVGGLSVHSNDNYNLISKLRMIPRGSFLKFIEKTK